MNDEIFVVIDHIRGQIADISYVMLAAAHELARLENSSVSAVFLGQDIQALAKTLPVERVLFLEHPALADFTPDAYLQVTSLLVQEHGPRAVLFGHTSIGMDIASGLSARLGLPLISSVHHFTPEGKFVSHVCGGKIVAEGSLPRTFTTLITMLPGGYKIEPGHASTPPLITSLSSQAPLVSRVSIKRYIEPDSSDTDITKEALLIAVGRGIQNKDNIVLAEELAEALGGVICASRPVVDQNWLPTTRLVGKSGFTVKPKMYLTLGISGAPEHTEAITGSDVIIAINTDPAAPIFNLAKYGTTCDLFDLVPVLTEKVLEAKSLKIPSG